MKFLKITLCVVSILVVAMFVCLVAMYLTFSATSYYIQESCENPDAITWISGKPFLCSPVEPRGTA